MREFLLGAGAVAPGGPGLLEKLEGLGQGALVDCVHDLLKPASKPQLEATAAQPTPPNSPEAASTAQISFRLSRPNMFCGERDV